MRVWFTGIKMPGGIGGGRWGYSNTTSGTIYVLTDTRGVLAISLEFGLEKLYRLANHLEINQQHRLLTDDTVLDLVDPSESLEFINFDILARFGTYAIYTLEPKYNYQFNNRGIEELVNNFNAKASGLGLRIKLVQESFGVTAKEADGKRIDTMGAKLCSAPYITRLESWLFNRLDISSFKCGSSLLEIGESCFCYSGITKIDFNDNLVSIGSKAFKKCERITTLVLPNSLRVLQTNAVETCDNLEYLEFNKGIHFVGSGAVAYCAKLREIKINVPSSGHFSEDAFNNCDIRKVHLARSLNDNPQIERILSNIKRYASGSVDIEIFD